MAVEKWTRIAEVFSPALSLVILVGRPPRYANVATSDYVPPPNPSTTTEHKTISVCEDEYTKFLQYHKAVICSHHSPYLSSLLGYGNSSSETRLFIRL
jgi:hypothetical protein